MANLTHDDVLKLAKLAKIELNDAEVKTMLGELSQIIAYIDKLAEADVSGLEPVDQVSGLSNSMRVDEVRKDVCSPSDLLNLAPSKEADQIKVRRMLG